MNRKKLRFIENMIIVTFPVVLFAGCAGGDIKPTIEEKPVATYSGYDNPLPETELVTISTTDESELPTSEPGQASQVSNDIASHDSAPYTPFEETNLNLEQDTQTVMQTTSSTPELPGNNRFKFDTDKYTLLDEQRQELQQHADYLIAHPDMSLVINGHADVRGSEDYNQQLSEKRAQTVYNVLVELGVPQSQLKKFAFGEHQPVHDEENWDENRRVELEFSEPVVLSSM